LAASRAPLSLPEDTSLNLNGQEKLRPSDVKPEPPPGMKDVLGARRRKALFQ